MLAKGDMSFSKFARSSEDEALDTLYLNPTDGRKRGVIENWYLLNVGAVQGSVVTHPLLTKM